MKTRRILHIIFALISLAIDIFLIVEACMNGGESGAQSAGFSDFLINIIKSINPNSILISDLDKFHAVIRKLFGHFLAFGGSGVFTMFALIMLKDSLETKKIRIVFISCSIWLFISLLKECIQLLTPGRAGQIRDVAIDFSGFLLFSGLIYIISYLIYLNKLKQSEERKE